MTLGVWRDSALKRGSRTSRLLGDSVRFEHHALTRDRRLHCRGGGCDRPVWLLAAKDRVEIHLAGG
jgi:hypothetical protein